MEWSPTSKILWNIFRRWLKHTRKILWFWHKIRRRIRTPIHRNFLKCHKKRTRPIKVQPQKKTHFDFHRRGTILQNKIKIFPCHVNERFCHIFEESLPLLLSIQYTNSCFINQVRKDSLIDTFDSNITAIQIVCGENLKTMTAKEWLNVIMNFF